MKKNIYHLTKVTSYEDGVVHNGYSRYQQSEKWGRDEETWYEIYVFI